MHTCRERGYTSVKSCFGNPLPLSLKVPALRLSLFPGEQRPSWVCAPLVGALAWPRSHYDRLSFLVTAALKTSCVTADILSMMISEEQVRRVAESLKTQHAFSAATRSTVAVTDPDLVAGIVDMLCCIPELRQDRVEQGRRLVNGSMPGSDELAAKLIGRVLSDSLR